MHANDNGKPAADHSRRSLRLPLRGFSAAMSSVGWCAVLLGWPWIGGVIAAVFGSSFVVVTVVLVAASIVLLFVVTRAQSHKPNARRDVVSTGLVGAILSLIVGHRVLGFPGFGGPTSASFDAGHHYEVVRWIVANKRPPGGAETFLDVYQDYPYAAHLAAAFWSIVTGLHPARVMSAMTVLFVVGALTATAHLVRTACRSLGYGPIATALGWLTPLAAVFLAPRYGVGAFTDDFFFSQLAGILAATVACVGLVGVGHAQHKSSRAGLVSLALVSAVIIATYPTHLAGPVLAAVICALIFPSTRSRAAAIGAGIAFGLLAEVPGKMGRNNDLSVRDGAVARELVASYGGWLWCALAVLGAATALHHLRAYRTGTRAPSTATNRPIDPPSTPDTQQGAIAVVVIVCGAAGPLLTAVGMRMFRGGIGPFAGFADYAVLKNHYAAAPFAFALAGLGIARIVTTIPGASESAQRRRRHEAIATAVLLVPFIITATRVDALNRRRPNPSPDLLLLMEHATKKDPPTPGQPGRIGVIGPPLSAYFVYESTFHRLNKPESLAVGFEQNPWTNWPARRRKVDQLLVEGRALSDVFLTRPGVRVKARLGDAYLLRVDDDTPQ